MTRSGRFRIDEALDIWHSRRQQRDPTQHFDDISEVPGPAQDVEKDPPELNDETGLAQSIVLPDPVPVITVPGGVPEYRRSGFHGYTATCMFNVPKQIAMAQDHRVHIRLRNYESSGTSSEYTVFIGSTQDEVVADGYPLEPDTELVIHSTTAVWGLVKTSGLSATDYVLVGVLAEYEWPVS